MEGKKVPAFLFSLKQYFLYWYKVKLTLLQYSNCFIPPSVYMYLLWNHVWLPVTVFLDKLILHTVQYCESTDILWTQSTCTLCLIDGIKLNHSKNFPLIKKIKSQYCSFRLNSLLSCQLRTWVMYMYIWLLPECVHQLW